jgi:hypothetical protein
MSVTSSDPLPLPTSSLDSLIKSSSAVGKNNGRTVQQNSHPTTGVMDRQLQLAQTINRNTFGFASRVVCVNLSNPLAQASVNHPRLTTVDPSSSPSIRSSTTSVAEKQSKPPSAKAQSNSNTSQIENPTVPQNKTEAQQKQLINTSEKFLTIANKLNEMRAQYEGQSGIGKYLPGNQSKAEVRATQQALSKQIQDYQFSQDPQINKQIVNLWLATASGLSPKDQKVIYNQIQQKLLGSEYHQEILQALNVQGNDPQIAAIRDAYAGTHPIHAFENQLEEQLAKGSLQDFVTSFTERGMDSKSAPQLLAERAAVKNLAENPTYADHKTTLQLLLHVYDAYLENDPHKLTGHLEALFKDIFQPVMDQMRNFSSLTPDAVKQQTEVIRNNFEAYNRVLNECLGGKLSLMQKQGKTDTLDNQLRTKLTAQVGVNIGQGLSQLFPALKEVIEKPNDPNAQKELQQKLQGRLDGFAVHQARLAHIAKASNDTDKASQIANLTAGFPNTFFPYEFQQHIDRVIAEGSINDPTTLGSLVPKMNEFGKEHQATVYRDAALKALQQGGISDQTRASLEKVAFTNNLYLNRTNPAEMTRIKDELLTKPFDIKTVHTLAEICNFQNLVDMSSVYKLSDAYIQTYRDAFIRHFGEFIKKSENINFLQDHMVWDQTYKLANQPITQLQASLEVIRDLLASDEFKDNKNLQTISVTYQQAIEAKQAKPDFT